jgi:hypothetical protein
LSKSDTNVCGKEGRKESAAHLKKSIERLKDFNNKDFWRGGIKRWI